ncbi:hypothetical protein PF002_g2887 [Phytophthora fragariae]|uniref:Uncharacterized protein n=1 Tax=Phytophthora fragariae TaxID=53985 RepID=A0A6A4ABW2_9STRA|nr:hypothetical protein PF003_g15755 [Phytophthora fragariae]KAE9254361.1 hypothetical protein PF002_g2887 [Phytophthora fragariae]
MRQRCADSSESPAKALASVKDSLDPKLLEMVSLYELQTTVDEVTEDQLVQLVLDRTNNVMKKFVPDLDGFFCKHLKMDLKEVDIDARVLKYYRDFSELIEQHGFGRLLVVGLPGDNMFEDRMKLCCKILLGNLEPQVLCNDVQSDTDVVVRLDTMLTDVLHKGFDPTLYEELRGLVFEYQKSFPIDVGETLRPTWKR